MTLQSDLEGAVAQVTADSATLRAIVHGPATGAASMVGGVKTLARAVADAETLIATQVGDLAGAVSAAQKSADTAAITLGKVESAGATHLARLAKAETASVQVVDLAAAAAAEGLAQSVVSAAAMVEQVETAGKTHLAHMAEAETASLVAVSHAGEAAAASFAASAEACRIQAARFALPIETMTMRALEHRLQRLMEMQDILTVFAARIEAASAASAMSVLTGGTGAPPEGLAENFHQALESAIAQL